MRVAKEGDMSIEMQEQKPEASMITVVFTLSFMDDSNQKMQASKKEETNNEELEMVSKPTEHSMDLIASPLLEKTFSLPK